MPLAQPTRQPDQPGHDWLALDRQLCFALYAGSLAMTKAYRPLLAPLGLTYPQYLVMLALWQHGPSTVGTLGEHLSLDSGTLTPLLKRLEVLGLLVRRRDAADERRVWVEPTAEGLALQQQAETVPQQMACSMACDLAELQELTTRLTTLRHRLQAGGAANPVSPPAARPRGAQLPSSPSKRT